MAKTTFLLVAAAVIGVACAQTVVDVLNANAQTSVLANLLQASGLASKLTGAGPFTVFAPTNTAIVNSIPSYKMQYLQDNQNALRSVLLYHVVAQSLDVNTFQNNQAFMTLEGSNIYCEFLPNTTTPALASATCEKDVQFVGAEITAENGMVQLIDTVLMPPGVFCPDELFFVEQRGESRVGFLGYDCRAKGTTAITDGEEKPVGIAVDSDSQTVFWSDDQNVSPYDSWLSKMPFQGGTVSNPFVTALYDPQGMDTDTVNKKLYFVEHLGGRVHRCNYDGSAIETLYVTAQYPADVAVDPEEELIFVTIQSDPAVIEGTVIAMFYNGTGVRTLATGLTQNYGLCVDTFHKHVYYFMGGHGGTLFCKAYGEKPCAMGHDGVVVTGLNYPYMCDVDSLYAPYGGPTKIVFSEASVPGSIYTVQSDGSNMQLINSDLNAPMGVKLGCFHYNA